MRRASRRDQNASEIKSALEQSGCYVVSLETVGGGVPDLLVVKGGRTILVETKTQDGKLSSRQRQFAQRWTFYGGQVEVVRDVAQALAVFGVK